MAKHPRLLMLQQVQNVDVLNTKPPVTRVETKNYKKEIHLPL
jgi:hypothetical protein